MGGKQFINTTIEKDVAISLCGTNLKLMGKWKLHFDELLIAMAEFQTGT